MGLKPTSGNGSQIVRKSMDASRIKQHSYTVSLLNEALRAGLLERREVFHIQHQLMLILKDLIRRYTRGESSSVPSDVAESLMLSLLYAMDARLKEFGHPEEAVRHLKRGEIRTMYEEGVERVQRCLEETKQLYKEVRRNRLDVAVEAYNATLDEAFPAFLKKYGVVFDAHNTMASIDYPLALDDMRLQGVFYMKQYLERLHMENKFCHLFDRAERMQLLDNFARVHRFDYRIELFNIFELMLHHAIFSILSGGESHRISISNFQFDRLKRLFHPTDRFRVRSLIHEALDRLLHDLQIREPEMKEYVRRCTGELVQRVVQTSRHDSLQSLVFADPKEPVRPASGISFHASDRMSDADLRKLIEKVLQCEHEEEKVRLIRSAVSSLYDYLDVLESDCLYGGEYRKLFATFSDTELAVLAKVVFYEELREGSLDFLNDPLHRPQYDREWESHLTDFFKRLNRSRLQSVERLIGQIRDEDISFY